MTLAYYIFYLALIINGLALDIEWTSHISSDVSKGFVLILLFIPVLLDNIYKNANIKRILKLILIYIFFNLTFGVLFDENRFGSIFLNSIYAFIIPPFLFWRYPDLYRYNFLSVVKSLPSILFIIGIIMNIVGLHPLFRIDYDGSIRLQATSIPSNYAMTILFAILAHTIDIKSYRSSKIWFLLYLTFLLILLFLTGSRMGLFCAILIIVFNMYKQINLNRFPKIIFLLIFFLTTVFIFIFKNSRNSSDTNNINTSGRETAWVFFWDEYKLNQMHGIGMGNSLRYFKSGEIEYFTTPHNEYLRLLLEGGLLLFIFVFIAILFSFYKLIQRYRVSQKKNLYYLMVLYLVILIYSITDNIFSTYQSYIYFLLFVVYLGDKKIKFVNSARG